MSAAAPVTRGTSNSNVRGSSYTRRARRQWLVATYAADTRLYRFGQSSLVIDVKPGETYWDQAEPCCRCYRCGQLLTVDTVTVDRIIPGCKGGTYRRTNIRPACGPCNSETGGALASHPKRKLASVKDKA